MFDKMNDSYENELSSYEPEKNFVPDSKPSFTQIITGILNILKKVVIGLWNPLNVISVPVTMKWLVNVIREKIQIKKVAKVAAGDLQAMLVSTSVAELDNLVDMGYTHIMADVDNSGQVQDIEVIKDTSDGADKQVEDFINRTGEGIVVVSG